MICMGHSDVSRLNFFRSYKLIELHNRDGKNEIED